MAEAGAGTAATDPAIKSRRTELVTDLARAREEVIAKRERLAGALENVRVQLLHLRSGVGSRADVAAELQSIEVD